MRRRAPKITYRTLKAEIRALLDRPGVVPDAEDRVLDWLRQREDQRKPSTPSIDEAEKTREAIRLERQIKAIKEQGE